MLMLIYVSLVLSVFLELVLALRKPKSRVYTNIIGVSVAMLAVFSASALVVNEVSGSSILLLIIAEFRIVNIARILKNRMNKEELKSRTSRTAAILGAASFVLATIYYVRPSEIDHGLALVSIATLQLIAASALFVSVFVARRIYRFRQGRKISDDKVPTVTVCIPARNETHDLPGCIESVLASTYPKLEILVLDDCSQDKTPAIIKKYAHDGVRFIKGQEPGDSWVPKNAAYDKLADEAKGDILLFIGVDVRLEPHSITELVGQLGERDMISVLPKRSYESEGAFFMQPIRYWWEMGLFRFSVGRPPVLSTCWAVRADFLEDSGGFEGLRKAIEPEAEFASFARKTKKYAFLIANRPVGITSQKLPKQQYETALRVRYMQLRRRPESVAALFVFELFFLVGPYMLLPAALILGEFSIAALALGSIVLLALANAQVYKLSLKFLWPLGLVSMPFLVAADWIVLAKSMFGYEFGEIEWKERNVCLPLLQVEEELPKL